MNYLIHPITRFSCYFYLTSVFFIFCLLAWLNSGTLSLYAVTLSRPIASYCNYLLNIDNMFFEELFNLLDGEPSENSYFLIRRILYPVLSYLPMLAFQISGLKEWFIYGGFVTNLVLYLIAIIILWKHLTKYYGKQSAYIGIALLVSYPGIYYWIGNPYVYNWIVPRSIFCYILLDLTARTNKYWTQIIFAIAQGIIYLGYDLWAFFIPASLLLLLSLKRYQIIPVYLGACLLPSLIYSFYLVKIAKINLISTNSDVYLQILTSYFNSSFYINYTEVLYNFPIIIIHNFVYSNFLFLPLAFFLYTHKNVLQEKLN